MKTAGIIAVSSFALARLVGAAPIVNRQLDVVYSTTTEEVWETTWTTTTIWVDPEVPAATATTTSVAAFYEQPVLSTSTSSTSTTTSVAVSTANVVAPVATSTPQASPTTTTAVYVAPTSTTTSVYVAPVTTTQAAAAVAVQSTTAVPVPTTTSSSTTYSSGTGDHTGDMTYYDVTVGLGSCGISGLNNQALVALATADMANGVNPNANPKCGKTINIYYNGVMKTATVFDTCPGCAAGSIDVTDTLFAAVAPSGDGRVHGVSWSFA